MQKITSRLSVKNTFFILNNYFCSIDILLDDISWAKKRSALSQSPVEFLIYLNATKNSWTACGMQEGFLKYSENTYQEVLSFKTKFMPKNLFDLAAICYTKQSAHGPDYVYKRIECDEYVSLLETLTEEEKNTFFMRSNYPGHNEKAILFPQNTLLSLFLDELLDNAKALALWSAHAFKKEYESFKLENNESVSFLEFMAWLIYHDYTQGFYYNSNLFLEPRKNCSMLHLHWLKEKSFIESYVKYTKFDFLNNLYLINSEKSVELMGVLDKLNFKITSIQD